VAIAVAVVVALAVVVAMAVKVTVAKVTGGICIGSGGVLQAWVRHFVTSLTSS
jgi:hypothetical protein